ncbi:hypothetical protein AGMMS50268_00410 [Spirochaetia bacterium]|nr:hypothetical protein AGMMS50268_00410 [Spirochaetia bacterium]
MGAEPHILVWAKEQEDEDEDEYEYITTEYTEGRHREHRGRYYFFLFSVSSAFPLCPLWFIFFFPASFYEE